MPKIVKTVLYGAGAVGFYLVLFGWIFPFANRVLLSIPFVREHPYLVAFFDAMGNAEFSIGLWIGLGFTLLQAFAITGSIATGMYCLWFLCMKYGTALGIRKILGKHLAEQFDPEYYRHHWYVRSLECLQRNRLALFVMSCFPVAFIAAIAAVVLFKTPRGFWIIMAANICKIAFFTFVYWPYWGMRLPF